MEAREQNLLRSVLENTWRFYAWVGFLIVVMLWGLYAYIRQLQNGLIVTGMRDQISWGLYITNFVFFIGISHAGTLISAILRVTDTEWRRPITRMAEAITVFALCIGAPMVMIDMGRPDRMLNLFRYGRIQSPIIWDVLGVSTYLTGCILYFYIPMIPDMALLADQPRLSSWRRRLYRALSLGWTGTVQQKHLLEKAISSMAIFIIPLAVSVHTVVSWIFAMTLRPGWNSSIFGPYFVVGAIYSGAAGVIFSMYVLRRVFHLEEYVEELHFRKLGLLLLAFSLIYLYFNINEYLTAGYKLEGTERLLMDRLFVGDYAVLFWAAQSVCVFIPAALMIAVLGFKRYHRYTIPGVVLSSALVVVGAWAKRYIIVVPTLRSPYLPSGQRLPWEWTHYHPTWVEWSITAAAVAGFALIYTLMAKLFPIVSIWETRPQEQEIAIPEVSEAVPSRWWTPGVAVSTLVLAVLLLYGISANAAGPVKPKQVKPATITAEWKTVPAVEASRQSAPEEGVSPLMQGRVFLYAGRLFGAQEAHESSAENNARPSPAVAVIASLRDASGAPISFKPVEFSAKTGLGTLALGSRPTLADGKAQLIVKDRRYGLYPVQVVFHGDEEYAPASFDVNVDFGVRPSPSLPRAGVLITPYATSPIAVPFLLFYGVMWAAFVYAFGYLIVWKMRRCPREGESASSKTRSAVFRAPDIRAGSQSRPSEDTP
ncbi:MAG TPA: NrfD/PsrC family molybdoenzyme membrane anchor subunit [Terriglobales bacterium]|nr:NrfD/PsrC family molybdoenzyme membrane anchor subunit [Terriglobales bacterium]